MSAIRSRSIPSQRWAVIVHGGAGDVPDDRAPRHIAGAQAAARAAAELLRDGASALDAVELAVVALEDDPVFNAGTGACLTSDGRIELDAAIMDGQTLAFGGVCALGPFTNPIAIARRVLEQSEHVLYAGSGAEAFARAHGFSPADPAAMITEAAKKKLESALAAGKAASWAGGTVGAVAIDASGIVAAATSTGGMSAKRPGRVGDSPLPGAGTYADDEGGAVSATGHGEGIMRVALASEIVIALRSGREAESAARAGIERLAQRAGTTGGVIVVDRAGKLAWARSTRTMTWAAAWSGGEDAGA